MAKQLKPRGGRVTHAIVRDTLTLVGYDDADTRGWTVAQRNRAYDWAMREHLAASDNDIARVPCPAVVPALRGSDGR